MSWIIKEDIFDKDRITTNSNKYMIGNGYMGYRGTLEEFDKTQLTATTLAGVYDRFEDKWREPVNAPNGLATKIYCDGEELNTLTATVVQHTQQLDYFHGVHERSTTFQLAEDHIVTFISRRFCSASRLHLLANEIVLQSSKSAAFVIHTGIDGDVWDINGPHLEQLNATASENILQLDAVTHELKHTVSVAEAISVTFGEQQLLLHEYGVFREIKLDAIANESYSFQKYVAVYTSLDDAQNCSLAAYSESKKALVAGFKLLLEEHQQVWREKWKNSDVKINGDDKAQEALRFSMYQLHIIAPGHSERLSIPARGLSGQVYKGAVFWDTEMFMLPFFLYTQPDIARNLMMYRVHTLEGARRKAAEYGYEGAFFAWESQETGDDACTLFNVNDVFTGRPMRTYFRDKQVHISADVAHGIWQYYTFTGDDSMLTDGGAEVIWECARFFYSYAYYNSRKQRYEILDVTGPDEYHERVSNNAFTNKLVKRTVNIALEAMETLKVINRVQYETLIAGSETTIEQLHHMNNNLYVPSPDENSLLIEQFDRYFTLEDVKLPELKSRILNKNEYLGGGNGIATTTQVLKQADVVLMLHLFKDQYDHATKQANWTYYEPRTEHGSSLSSCIYAMVAADVGSSDWAYPYFLRTATIDLTGDSKQYVGDLYIGGTHPAANGGAWMAAVLGFAGVHFNGQRVQIKPSLPEQWCSIQFPLLLKGQLFQVTVDSKTVVITTQGEHPHCISFEINEQLHHIEAGQELRVELS
ncbi:MAG: glycoside hydrolase family 65 protein [Candidatus Pristimantibacillus lignocellulolyticus]|uniref:Glycoside hydrolase family 65 protein n=1 Tax=Candidatus Pristimantibacillus lignocellulolyticus TaxID=2994561 RepID=A0A9J6ZBJ8_9BACL|nr:MAG: glycoside hydrolase family 65 protein [Candidatus Pristimantibacillus lignocellulolyticus]